MTFKGYPRIRLPEGFKKYTEEEFGGDTVNAVRFRVFGHCLAPTETVKLEFDRLKASELHCAGNYQPEIAELRELASRMVMTASRVNAWQEARNDI